MKPETIYRLYGGRSFSDSDVWRVQNGSVDWILFAMQISHLPAMWVADWCKAIGTPATNQLLHDMYFRTYMQSTYLINANSIYAMSKKLASSINDVAEIPEWTRANAFLLTLSGIPVPLITYWIDNYMPLSELVKLRASGVHINALDAACRNGVDTDLMTALVEGAV
jgi:hypothetical protein